MEVRELLNVLHIAEPPLRTNCATARQARADVRALPNTVGGLR